MASKKETQERFSASYYAKLLIYRTRKVALATLIGAGTILLTIMLQEFKKTDGEWIHLFLPVMGIGALYLLFPSTERWHYAPWQTTAQRVERNTKD